MRKIVFGLLVIGAAAMIVRAAGQVPGGLKLRPVIGSRGVLCSPDPEINEVVGYVWGDRYVPIWFPIGTHVEYLGPLPAAGTGRGPMCKVSIREGPNSGRVV